MTGAPTRENGCCFPLREPGLSSLGSSAPELTARMLVAPGAWLAGARGESYVDSMDTVLHPRFGA